MPLLISLISGLLVFSALHLLLWRRRVSNAPRMKLLFSISLVAVAVCAAVAWLLGERSPAAYYLLLTSVAFLLTAYAFFYAGTSRSVSITILGYLLESPQAPVGIESIQQKYNGTGRFKDRIRDLESGGFVRMVESQPTLTPLGRQLALSAQRLAGIIGRTLEG